MACGACAQRTAKTEYVHTDRDGKVTRGIKTEVEARAAVARKGGTYKPQ